MLNKKVAGVLRTSYDNQTQYLIDKNNMIISDYIMNAKMNYRQYGILNNYYPETVDLSFNIPGYDPNNLIFCIFPHEQFGVGYKEYALDNKTQKINLKVTNDTTEGDVDKETVYEVNVYNGVVSEANLVGKALFVVTNQFQSWNDGNFIKKFPLVDGNGNPVIYQGNEIVDSTKSEVLLSPGEAAFLTFAEPYNFLSSDGKVKFSAPTELFPSDARSIKVVVFASDPKYRYYDTMNIDKYMYPFYHNDCIMYKPSTSENLGNASAAPYLVWTLRTVDLKEVSGQPVEYEFHFYKNEVVEGNFLFKATGVTFFPPLKK